MLVAMHQLGIPHGIGVGTETSAVIEDGRVEVVGDEGVLLIDLSHSRPSPGAVNGFHLSGARLSYLEHGDRFDMSTLEVTPAAAKLDGFELGSGGEASESAAHDRPAAGDLLAVGELLRLLREAIDGPRPEALGFAFTDGEGDARQGFRFRFHSLDDTRGWLSVNSGADRYTIVNIGLDVSVAGRAEKPIQ